MALHLHNVRTRQKEAFQPIRDGHVGVYVCGLTVYDHMHIGHARTAVAFEVIRRWLERTYEVTFVQNVTDVDDKILNRAAELGVSPRAHAATWDQRAAAACARLGVRAPDQAPHVTESIPQIIGFIQDIVANGFAYATDAGNVYFDVPAYDESATRDYQAHGYGCLSRRDYREMAAGTRKAVEGDKHHPADFALWKAASEGDHADASWDSPWGPGRPGWHIECSVMATEALGDRIDIHGGGQDLIFPHHENEIAQSQAKTGKAPFVETWLHAGFLNVDGQKMSKSLGNFIVLEEFLDEMDAEGMDAAVLRLYFLLTHYRSKIDFSRSGLKEAARQVERIHRARALLAEAAGRADDAGRGDEKANGEVRKAALAMAEAFDAAMDDDIHTPTAIASIHQFLRAANPYLEAGAVGAEAAASALALMDERLDILTISAVPAESTSDAIPDALRDAASTLAVELADEWSEDDAVQAMLAARQLARKEKDWARADAVRDRLGEAGYVIEDTPQGPRWQRA